MPSLPSEIRVNVRSIFPSQVTGSGPITIAKSNGVWTIGYQLVGLAANPGYPTNAGYIVPAQDPVAGTIYQIPLSSILSYGYIPIADAAYAAAATDRTIVYTSITASRIVTLPAAVNVVAGLRVIVADASGSVTSGHSIVVTPNGTDTINGVNSSYSITTAYGFVQLMSNGVNGWTIVTATAAVISTATTGQLAYYSSSSNIAGATNSVIATAIAPVLPPGGIVNKFRNGTMDIWQRGTAPVVSSNSYTADGWIVSATGANPTVNRAAGRSLSIYSLQVTGATSVTDVQVIQRIESFVAAPMTSQTVTFQAWVYNSTGGTITPTITVQHPTVADTFGTLATDLAATNLQACSNSVWTQVAYTFAMSANAANGMQITLDFGNNFSTNGKLIRITECDLRVTPGLTTGLNSAPPTAELRPYAIENLICYRYFMLWNDQAVALGYAYSSTNGYCCLELPVAMRVQPTLTTSGTIQILCGNTLVTETTLSFNPASNVNQAVFNWGVASGATAGQGVFLYLGGGATLSLSAEL